MGASTINKPKEPKLQITEFPTKQALAFSEPFLPGQYFWRGLPIDFQFTSWGVHFLAAAVSHRNVNEMRAVSLGITGNPQGTLARCPLCHPHNFGKQGHRDTIHM